MSGGDLALIVFAVAIAAALWLPKLGAQLCGWWGLIFGAAMVLAANYVVVSQPFVATPEEVRDDLDGLGAILWWLMQWTFGIGYGLMAMIAIWRNAKRLQRRKFENKA